MILGADSILHAQYAALRGRSEGVRSRLKALYLMDAQLMKVPPDGSLLALDAHSKG